MSKGPGIDPFNDEADVYFDRYRSADPASVHADLIPHLPKQPAKVLDVGAGMLRDAAWLADLGHEVTAAEPAGELMALGRQYYADKKINCVEDSLPDLSAVRARNERYDLIVVGAVWMFIPPEQRAESMQTLRDLMAPGGRLLCQLARRRSGTRYAPGRK